MAYDFCLKKKWFGGLDPDSVTEYITKIKALILLSREVQGVNVYVFQLLMCDWNSFRNS